MLVSVYTVQKDNYILYQNRLHIITRVSHSDKYTHLILSGLYFPHTIVNLTFGKNSLIDLVEPIYINYVINKWNRDYNFEIIEINSGDKINIDIFGLDVNKIIYLIYLNQNPKIRLYFYKDIIGITYYN